MEDARSQHRVRPADGDAVGQVLQRADPAGGDHRDADRVRDRTGELEIEALPGAVAIHAGEQDLARTQALDFDRPLDRVAPGGLASAVGVDLPAPVGGALGVDGDPRIHWAIEVLDRQTAHMGRLLDDLLDVSRIVQGRIELEPVELRVRELLQQAADGARALMEEHRHRFVCRLPAPGWRVLGDPVRLSQILLNILVNAANYTPPGGEIRIESRIEGDSVLIQVRDNGQGMTAEQLDSLFGLFTRGPHASDADNGGLGLGLAIARRLAELHGGRLEARSDGLGRGTELCLRLPVLTDAPRMNVSASPDDPPAPPAGEKPRVLVVDDDPDVVDALAMLLEILGYPVEVARSGPEALELARRQCPRVALLDIGLPGMDGLEIARRLRADYADPKRLKLVALTGLGHEQARERSLAAGFDEHLVKPLGRQALLALLESLG